MQALLAEYGDFLVLMILFVFIVSGFRGVLDGLYSGEPDRMLEYGQSLTEGYGIENVLRDLETGDDNYDSELKRIAIYRTNYDIGIDRSRYYSY